ncbi:MuF-like minor capsid protein [Microbacterium phage Balsa]|uniref:MuF-like minor capsid protein n=3 Tax=Ilzatvirus hamlet TaxID=2560591 RepID=A0A345MEH3_9CAUD|nr:head morphogenesis [Microbacterium phage Hamlet]AUX82840.1 MuF-like minor capsid protein [Microbacterium phage Hamlet]AUX83530.1 MuF-like minor capsid protein [Microbacterium phage Balsa]AXH68954.1 MuF-like minor capsid protein [Microbacterium phage Schnapsidee]
MATVPTGKLERELRKLYVSWVAGLPRHEGDMEAYIESFRVRSQALIQRLGGDVARLGVYLADFPAPKELELSPYAGKIYDEMQLAAIRASVASGLNAKDAARAMLRAGLERSFYKLTRLARTETVSAYWKNQWDSTRGLDLVMLWSVEFGPRTCAWCKERDGMVVEYSNIRDHPNGRCTLAPTLPSRVRYKGSLDPDGNIYYDPNWVRNHSQATRPGEALTLT